MNSVTWIGLALKLVGDWLKKPSTYWKARQYLKKKEAEDAKNEEDAIDFANRR